MIEENRKPVNCLPIHAVHIKTKQKRPRKIVSRGLLFTILILIYNKRLHADICAVDNSCEVFSRQQ